MARPLRIEFSGAIYHVTSRGNAREDIWLDDTDRAMFLGVLAKVISRFDWRCHAYCLMDNHYHLLIETPEPNLSKGMRQLNGVYTQRFNRRHGRVGHVFQGRYKAILVERDSYLKELARYVVLNPVRAKRVQHPGEWPWSSYAMTAGKAASPVWLSTEWLLGQLGSQRERAQNAYVRFVEEGQGLPSLWTDLQQQIYLGSDEFIERLQSRLLEEKEFSEVPKVQRLITRSLQWYKHQHSNPKVAMAKAYESGAYTLAQIAGHFGVHYSTVSRAVKQLE
jgi:REP element-mobilizing transposase RayT